MNYLIVGLGNPTKSYEQTRHNVGFMIIDSIIAQLNSTEISKSSFKGELFKTLSLFFLKPTTYMNLSGESILAVRNYYKIENIIVIHDDLDLGFGVIRFKKGGGHGGHNGLKSIDSLIGKDYIRVRIGIGKPQSQSVVKFVLSSFAKEQEGCLEKIIDLASEAVLEIPKIPLEKISSLYSRKKSICIETI